MADATLHSSSRRNDIETIALGIAREAAQSDRYSIAFTETTTASSSRSTLLQYDGGDDEVDSEDEEDEKEAVQPSNLTITVGRPIPPPSYAMRRVMTVEELRKFVLKPASQTTRFLCQITRTRQKGHPKYNPHYDVYIEDFTNLDDVRQQHFLWARKRKRRQTSCYDIGATIPAPDGMGEIEEILGKVKSNFFGTNFTIYSQGRNPFRENSSDVPSDIPVREELAVVAYDPNMLGFKGPRKMTILMPSMTRDGERTIWRPTKEEDTLSSRFKAGNTRDMLVLHNKSPQWNEDTQAFVLNFGGRVTQASVKNFQLVHDQDLDYIILQFGRTDLDTFTMDFQYPLCPLQALGMVLTSFDAKIACE